MKTNIVYDKVFCTRCKITDTFLYNYFKVKVVENCAANYCFGGNSKGKFFDF